MKAVARRCIGIGLAYGSNQVLQDITLAIEPGEFFALLGPSGSGRRRASQADRRIQSSESRPIAGRWARHQPHSATRSQYRNGVSELCAVAAHERV